MELKITCKGQKYLNIDKLKNFQGNLKRLKKEQLKKLKQSIIKYGFSFPVFVWDNFILDGHQRLYATKLLLKEDYTIGDIPIIEIMAKDKKEAAEKLLLLNSQYANITNEGFDEYLKDFDLDLDLIIDNLELPQIDIDFFLNSPPEEVIEKVQLVKSGRLEDLAPTKEELSILDGKKFLIAFSGGKDSTAVAVWAKNYFPNNSIELCFCDMGADFVGFNNYLDSTADLLGLNLKVLRSKEGMIELFLSKGKFPHFSNPYCHKVLNSTMNNYVNTFGSEDIVMLRGGRSQERAPQRSKINEDRFLKVSDMPDYYYFQPLYFSEKNTAECILNEANVPTWEGYTYGLQRTACRICPGQKPQAYAALRINYPDVWEELIYIEKKLGPFAWERYTKGRHWSFTEMADNGEDKFYKDVYKLKYS